jgi:hypothetical protein
MPHGGAAFSDYVSSGANRGRDEMSSVHALCLGAAACVTALAATATAMEDERGKALACKVIRVPAPAKVHVDPYAKYLHDEKAQAWALPIPPGYMGRAIVETQVCG